MATRAAAASDPCAGGGAQRWARVTARAAFTFTSKGRMTVHRSRSGALRGGVQASDGRPVDGRPVLHPISHPGGVTREAFEAVAVEAVNDVFADRNPGGFVDLATVESCLLDGWVTSGTGKERPSPSSGSELRTCAAQLLVEGGAGAPWAASQGWLEAEWVTLLGTKREAEAVEMVVAAALHAVSDDDDEDGDDDGDDGGLRRTGVIVVAPYRPAWPSPDGPLLSPRVSDVDADVDVGRARAVVASVDPAAFGGDVHAALLAAEAVLRAGGEEGGAEVGAVVVGNPSPATGRVLPLGDALIVNEFCQSRRAHVVADETMAAAAFVRATSAAAAAAGAGAGDGPIGRRVKRSGGKDGGGTEDGDGDDDAAGFGRRAGFISTSSLWRKGDARSHVLTAFGAAAGLPRGKTSCLLITRDTRVRWGAGTDPYANGLAALFVDGGTAAREAFAHHNRLLRRRQDTFRGALDALGIATGVGKTERHSAVPSLASDGGAVAWVDLRRWCGGSWAGEARVWDQLASVHRVLLVPGCLCGAAEPGWFRACVAGTEEAMMEGLERLELGIRHANDTGGG